MFSKQIQKGYIEESGEKLFDYNLIGKIFTKSSDYVYIIDKDFRIIFCNESAEKTFGITTDEKCHKILKKEKNACYHCPAKKSYIDNKEHKRTSKIHTKGKIKYIRETYIPIFDNSNKGIGCLVIGRDISRKKYFENKLKKVEKKYQYLINEVSDIIFTLNKKGKIISINENGAEFFGLPEKELIGKNIFSFATSEYKEEFKKKYLIFTKNKVDSEFRFLGKFIYNSNDSGNSAFREKMLEIKGKNLIQKGKFLNFAGIAIDKTEINNYKSKIDKMSEEILNQKKELVKLNLLLDETREAKENMLTNITHEFMTPLNSIIGFSAFLLKEREENLGKDLLQEIAESIKISGDKLVKLINNIMEISKSRNSIKNFEISNINVNKIIAEILSYFNKKIIEKQITLKKKIKEDNIVLEGDKTKFKQIIFNLVSNAVKFTKENGRIKIDLSQNEEKVKIIIYNSGKGILKEDFKRIFQEFVQGGSNLNRNCEGFGLGLTIVKKYVDLHNGEILVNSRQGIISKFTVVLPKKQRL